MDRNPPPQFARDLALVRAARNGEERAILKLVERLRCIPRILTAQNAKFGFPLSEHDLADLVQDTAVVILGKLDLFAGRAPLEGWVYRVCCLEFMNGLRRSRRQPVAVDHTTAPVVDERADVAREQVTQREQLLLALERVGGAEAEAVALKHFEGLTFAEIGERLDVPTNTAKTRYYRGLSQLEQILSREMEQEER
ncbi:MAG: sigma-70 family RNA polymerase sigma factor [Planctomycetota bacterium]